MRLAIIGRRWKTTAEPRYVKGRSNLAATVYVPWDCPNSCPFCSSKEEYKHGVDASRIIEELGAISRSSIEEVVFTGGEPSARPSMLSDFISTVPSKRVFVNTTLLDMTVYDFVYHINRLDNVRGLNISRHGRDESEDGLHGTAPDEWIARICKPVHINVVAPKVEHIPAIIDRWAKVAEKRRRLGLQCPGYEMTICIREDYTNMTMSGLHNPHEDPYIKGMIDTPGFEYYYHTSCNVCDTVSFMSTGEVYPHGLCVNVHRGVEKTSIQFGNTVEVNDIVLFPDGTLCYDWDKSCIVTDDMRNWLGLNAGGGSVPSAIQTPYRYGQRSVCGGFGCRHSASAREICGVNPYHSIRC